MAVIEHSSRLTPSGAFLSVWEGLESGDTGLPLTVGGWPDRTVQMVGTGPVTLEGSMDGETWGVLTDISGEDLVLEDNKPRVIGPNVIYIRPNADGSGSIYIAASRG